MSKPCTKCGETKPLSDFSPDRSSKSGHKSYCKQCAVKMAVEYRWRNIDHIREYRRRHSATEKYKQARRDRYSKNPKRGDSPDDPFKEAARRVVSSRLRSGELSRLPCQRCGASEHIEAHHEDYGKPLDVTWLCRSCHGLRHRELNEIARRAAE